MAVDTRAPMPLRIVRNTFLFAFSVFLLPLDLYLLMSTYVLQVLLPFNGRRDARRRPAFAPKTVLVTGIGTTKGVAMARMFYEAGHDVIGAETMTSYLSPWGRWSKAIRRFYPLPSPTLSEGTTSVRSESYFSTVRWIIREHKVHLWVSCSEDIPAVVDAELGEMIAKDTICKAINFDEATVKKLTSVDSLMEHLGSLGLPVPDSHSVSSRDQIHQLLKHANMPATKPYLIRQSNIETQAKRPVERIRLPKRTVSETYEAVAKVPITAENPYVLQAEVTGRQYSTHSLIIGNEVQTFVAFEISPDMSYESLPADGSLTQAMLRYTQEFARRSEAYLAGHVSFTFAVDEHATEKGSVQLLFATDCKPRITTGCVLLNDRPRETAYKYLQAGSSRLSNGHSGHRQSPISARDKQRVYWMGFDISNLVWRSLFMCLTFQMGPKTCITNLLKFARHVLFWKEATFEIWDPLPSFWLYHVQWPAILLGDIWPRRRSATSIKSKPK